MAVGCRLLFLFTWVLLANALNEKFAEQLASALSVANTAISNIYNEWEVAKYPNFLKSCFMHKSSWVVMKTRFQKKIIDAALARDKRSKLIVSFTGTYVTAGHDSPFNVSTPVVTDSLMKPVLAALSVDLETRSLGIGANPCTPYDVCIQAFVGNDPDIVHWEQTYFCQNKPIIEQFVRQASFIPSNPIVVFSESATGSWNKKSCTDVPREHTLTGPEKLLLTAQTLELVSELNRDEYHRVFGYLQEYTHLYHSAGIQTFHHKQHEAYKCQGPYIPDWNKGAVSWLPSPLGHRLRASHYAYFWLLLWAEAIKDLQGVITRRRLDAIQRDIDNHMKKMHTTPKAAKHDLPFSDETRCMTDLEPRVAREASLREHVLEGLDIKGRGAHGWNSTIYEDLTDPSLVILAQKMGYLDYKWLLHGNKNSGPLSISVTVEKDGPMFICQAPAAWGKLPHGFVDLWSEGATDIFLTYDVADTLNFKFDKGPAKKYHMVYDKSLDICAQVRVSELKQNIPKGSHVLTVVPRTNAHVMVAWLVYA